MGFLPCITSTSLRGPCSYRQSSSLSHTRLPCTGEWSAVSSSSMSAATLAGKGYTVSCEAGRVVSVGGVQAQQSTATAAPDKAPPASRRCRPPKEGGGSRPTQHLHSHNLCPGNRLDSTSHAVSTPIRHRSAGRHRLSAEQPQAEPLPAAALQCNSRAALLELMPPSPACWL